MKPLAIMERPYYAASRPIVEALVRAGVRPNAITTFGTALVLLSAVAYGAGSLRLGGLLLLVSGFFDTLDGQVARHGEMVTRFGAFYDSTVDRIGDGATFIGIAVFLLTAPEVPYRIPAVIACMVATLASLLVSYSRARAEGLGLDCKVGLAQRAERIIVIGLVSVLAGDAAQGLWLEVAVAFLGLMAIVTVVQRILHVYRQAEGATPISAARRADAPPPLNSLVKGP